MNAQEIELWARDIIARVLSNQPIEDSRVELKSEWIQAEKAAERLAGHANAARGIAILWLIGVDEKNKRLTNVDHLERESWYTSIQKHFDGFAPRLSIDVNIRVEGSAVVALYFETAQESPYVVKNSKGGSPDFFVPWREGTRLRAARRDELLSILTPRRRFAALIDELEFNIAIGKSVNANDYRSWGCLFREEEFHRAMRDGALATLPTDVKELLHKSYIVMGRANQRAVAALSNYVGGPSTTNEQDRAKRIFIEALPIVESACDALRHYIKS
jgi:hypothetical protein